MTSTAEQSATPDHSAPRSHIAHTLSGNAIITLHSLRTGRRFMYHIVKAPLECADLFYVDLLDGTNNEDSFFPIGRIKDMDYIYSTHSLVPSNREANLAFAFYWHNILQGHIHPDLEIIHIQNNPMELDSDSIRW